MIDNNSTTVLLSVNPICLVLSCHNVSSTGTRLYCLITGKSICLIGTSIDVACTEVVTNFTINLVADHAVVVARHMRLLSSKQVEHYVGVFIIVGDSIH